MRGGATRLAGWNPHCGGSLSPGVTNDSAAIHTLDETSSPGTLTTNSRVSRMLIAVRCEIRQASESVGGSEATIESQLLAATCTSPLILLDETRTICPRRGDGCHELFTTGILIFFADSRRFMRPAFRKRGPRVERTRGVTRIEGRNRDSIRPQHSTTEPCGRSRGRSD